MDSKKMGTTKKHRVTNPPGICTHILISKKKYFLFDAATRDRTGDLQIFSLTLSQLSHR